MEYAVSPVRTEPGTEADPAADLIALYREALHCRACFDTGRLKHGVIDVPQFRSIGPRYFASSRRVLVLLINPGGGRGRAGRDNVQGWFRDRLVEFRDGAAEIGPIMNFLLRDLPNWGRSPGVFIQFLQRRGLDAADIAIANVAWCSTDGDDYPSWMLKECFNRHTTPLLRLLDPQVVLLCGDAVHPFEHDVARVLREARVLKTLHFAHREGSAAEQRDAARIKTTLQGL